MTVKLRQFLLRIKHRPPRDIGFLGLKSTIVRPHWISGAKNVRVGSGTYIHRFATINAGQSVSGSEQPPSLVIGDNVYIGPNAWISCANEVRIGDGCMLSEQVYINDVSHGVHPEHGLIRDQDTESKGPVRIGKNCFLGFRCCVLPGVELGNNCVVGINSVVTRSFPAYSMLAGSPARCIKTFSFDKGFWISASGPPDEVD